jgi:hypothetical protein
MATEKTISDKPAESDKNQFGLNQAQALRWEIFKIIIPYIRDINSMSKKVEDIVEWLDRFKS